MKGIRFTGFQTEGEESRFDQMLKLFTELLQYTSGDANEALSWLTELDRQHGFTTSEYGIGDFIKDLKEKGYLEENENNDYKITPRTEQTIRKQSLEQIF